MLGLTFLAGETGQTSIPPGNDRQEESGIRATKPINPSSTRAHAIQYVRGPVHSFHGFWKDYFSRILT